MEGEGDRACLGVETGMNSWAHLAQMEVCVTEEIGMVLAYQADHIVIQLVLFEHGDGQVRLFHCHVEPAGERQTWGLLDPCSCWLLEPLLREHVTALGT